MITECTEFTRLLTGKTERLTIKEKYRLNATDFEDVEERDVELNANVTDVAFDANGKFALLTLDGKRVMRV